MVEIRDRRGGAAFSQVAYLRARDFGIASREQIEETDA